ncbi:response regulator [Paenibacillus sp. P26]|nr:response regulator [Paenibacillus sp. P26]
MYKVAVVDDEIWIRREIRAFIEWSGLELELAGEAGNGREAMELILRTSPHLVVTDIKMPMMDGLELLRWVDERKLPCKMIVLSGYGDFEYTRQALQHRAFDYVLKPLKETELALIFSRAMDELRRESERPQSDFHRRLKASRGLSLMKDRFFQRILTDRSMDDSEIIVGCDELNISPPAQGYRVATVKFFAVHDHLSKVYGGDWELFDFAVRNILDEAMTGNGLYFHNSSRTNEYLLIAKPVDRPFFEKLSGELERRLKLPVWIGLGRQRQRYDALAQSYQESLQALLHSPAQLQGHIAEYRRENDETFRPDAAYQEAWERLIERLTLYLEGGQASLQGSVMRQLNALLTPSPPQSVTWRDVRTGYSRLLITVEKMLLEQDFPAEAADLLQRLKQNQEELDTEAMPIDLGLVLDLLSKARTQTHPRNKSGKELIHTIKKYVEEYCHAVTLEEISRNYFLNKNYFCSLFKQVTGRTSRII